MKIQIYPSINDIHSSYKGMISNPPKNCEFVGSEKAKKQKYIDKAKNYEILRQTYKLFNKLFNSTKLLKHSYNTEILSDIDLIFSTGNLYYGDGKWILDILDNPYGLTGYDYNLFIKNRSKIESLLLKENCKKIICANESSIEIMKKHFSNKLMKKIVLVRPGVKISLKERKIKKNKEIKLLFIGSVTNPDDFYIKGGLETLRTFESLDKKHNATLTIRCKVPDSVRKRIKNNPNINLIEDMIPFEELKNLYKESDIYLMPGHSYFLMAFLEAMSYSLPIVTLDTYGVRDIITNNQNGVIIPVSKKNNLYQDPSYPTNLRSKEFISKIKEFDEELIENIVKKVEYLIENPKIREEMGKNAQKTVKTKFSVESRNKSLSEIFQKST